MFVNKIRYCFSMVKAIMQLHSLNIAHRDIKLENFLIKKQNNIFIVKIADFGCSRNYTSQVNNHTTFGTKGPIKIKINQQIQRKINQTNFGTEIYNPPQIIVRNKTYRNFQSPDIWQLSLALLEIIYKKTFINSDFQRFMRRFQQNKNLTQNTLENILGKFTVQKSYKNQTQLLEVIFSGLVYNPDERLVHLGPIQQLLQPYELYQSYRFQNRNHFNILKYLLPFQYIVNVYLDQIDNNEDFILLKGRYKKDPISLEQECTVKIYKIKNQALLKNIEQEFKIFRLIQENQDQKLIKILKICDDIIKHENKNSLRFVIFQKIKCTLQIFDRTKLKIYQKLNIMYTLCQNLQLLHTMRLILNQLEISDIGMVEERNIYTEKIINFSKAQYFFNKSASLDIWYIGKCYLELIYNLKNLHIKIDDIKIPQIAYQNQSRLREIILIEKNIQKLMKGLTPFSSHKLQILEQNLLGTIFDIFPELKSKIQFVRKISQNALYETYSIRYQSYETKVTAIIKIYQKKSQKPKHIYEYILRQQHLNKNLTRNSPGILQIYDSNMKSDYAYVILQSYITDYSNFINQFNHPGFVQIIGYQYQIFKRELYQSHEYHSQNLYLVGTNDSVTKIKLGNFVFYMEKDNQKKLHLDENYISKSKKYKPPQYFIPKYQISRFESDVWMLTITFISFLINQRLLKSDEAIETYYQQLLQSKQSYQIDFRKVIIQNNPQKLNYVQQIAKFLSKQVLKFPPIHRTGGLKRLLEYQSIQTISSNPDKHIQKSLSAFETHYKMCQYVSEFVNIFIYITTNQRSIFGKFFNKLIDQTKQFNYQHGIEKDLFFTKIKDLNEPYFLRISSWSFLISFLQRKFIKQAELKLNYDQLANNQKFKYSTKKKIQIV